MVDVAWPGFRIPGAPTPPVPLASPLLAGLTAGPVALLDFANPVNPVAGVPADGATVPDLAAALTTQTIGAAAPALPVRNTVPAGSAAARVQRTAKGGLHYIGSQSAQTALEAFAVGLGAERLAWLAGHLNHHFYASAWFRTTRVAASSYTASDVIAGLVQGDPNGSNAGNRWASVAASATTLAVAPTSGSRYLGHRTRRDGPSAGQYAFFGAAAASVAPPSFTPSDRLLHLGPNAAAYLNQFPSIVLYQAYIEDLTVSGRTFAEVQAIDEADYIAQVLTEGGRFYGDTWNDPATMLP